jgi:hypothetical protein
MSMKDPVKVGDHASVGMQEICGQVPDGPAASSGCRCTKTKGHDGAHEGQLGSSRYVWVAE